MTTQKKKKPMLFIVPDCTGNEDEAMEMLSEEFNCAVFSELSLMAQMMLLEDGNIIVKSHHLDIKDILDFFKDINAYRILVSNHPQLYTGENTKFDVIMELVV